jgi:alpha-tubulin suppressor-like RCC1 family protein
VKFTKGRLYFIGRNRKGFYEKKAIRGAIFNDDIQGVNIDKEGTPFIITGKRDTLLLKLGGELYRLEFKYF